MKLLKSKLLSMVVTLTLAIAFMSSGILSTSIDAKVKLKIYNNSQYGFQMGYADGWVQNPNIPGNVVGFSEPKKNAADPLGETIAVGVQDLSKVQGVTLQKYDEAIVKSLKLAITNFKLVKKSNTKLSGNTAIKIEYTGTQDKINMEYMQVLTIVNKKAYFITFVGDPKTYSSYTKTVDSMVNSFKLK